MSKGITVLGIGSASINILNNINSKEQNLQFLCIDNDEDNLRLAQTRALLFRDFASVGQALAGEDNIVVILPLGGNFGSDIGQYIIRYLINQNKNISVITTMPFTFEGNKKISLARSALSVIENLVFDTTVFNNNKLIEELKTQTSVKDTFRIIDEIIYDILKEKFL